ncbi:AOC03_06830 family ribosome hibernation factor [Caldilinea sp.]|uniref:AOC03_06830 family ribosome hibernation factor n=1 Tax=Caldilinea sp. TaxID=2293560 RepID=UPI0021DCB332|nr:hypothetical protein [Caldilinea sp.]GIV71214.1 MAG: hypothetical protein KatS3mg048_4076 [Caldilinea sp.]
MNRQDISLLQQISGYPAVTITMPTHRTSPENKQDPIRLRNLVKQATERLLSEFSRREVEPILGRLEHLASSVDFRHALDGLALFVHRDFARSITLPFTLKERVVIDETFFTRDLVFAMNRTPRYWVLVLSEKPTRLFEATRDDLLEIQGGGFPMVHEGPGGEAPLPGGFGVKRSHIRDEAHRQFFRKVDEALKPFMNGDPLPLAVVGVDRYLAFFDEVSSHKDAIIARVQGSHDKTSAHELGKLVWPAVKEALAEERRKVLEELDKAVGEQKYVSTIGEVWRLAQEGRGRLLLVEEDFHYPAVVDESGMILSPAEDPEAPGVIDDAVDEIIETVLAKQGRVVFVENGQLAEHQRIALILRY